MTTYWCEHAWLGGDSPTSGVSISVIDRQIGVVETGVVEAPSDAEVLWGLTFPGFANAHSHAFHRALRGRTHSGSASFWTWREQMYATARALTPDTYHALARATFAEMAQAGITCVGEFHYVHHQLDGTPYQSDAMGEAVLAAAADVGIRITLLDTCYLNGGIDGDGHIGLGPDQRRFSDGTVDAWAERTRSLPANAVSRIGAAVHSVRAVDPAAMAAIGEIADAEDWPLHLHLSEQPLENEQCLAAFGRTPTELVADAGLLTPRLTAVHATHLTDDDVALLGDAGVGVCLCPSTERDLADGVGPALRLARAGSALSLGTDSNAVIDMLAEARSVELDQGLVDNERGHHGLGELLAGATINGHRALGWADGGEIRVGAAADLVTISLDSVRLAGLDRDHLLDGAVFAATAVDVDTVIVDGQRIVSHGVHVTIDAGAELATSIAALGSVESLTEAAP